MEQINLQKLIKQISPLYNSYKESKGNINGTEALFIMWEIGELLKKKIEEFGIAPHNLYRKIYGKAEGKEDIIQRSYITREFLGRAYRIRNIFENKNDIEKDFPNLKKFILFREAMPFFDNKKYMFKGRDREDLLTILNSNESSDLIFKRIKLLQKEKIGIKNSRNQKLIELQPQKEIFITFYNYVFNLIKDNNYRDTREKVLPLINNSLISKLSSNTSALAQEGLVYKNIDEEIFDDYWISYSKLLKGFSEQMDAKERRRFRRLISPERIIKLADMLQVITSEKLFVNFKNQLN
ncbi:MAG: hypothetical protein KAS02_00210 [Candidatus Pacebacteria bacterium]|nr:hypothetical protein [Candidatus Paceibacterota bacterium]